MTRTHATHRYEADGTAAVRGAFTDGFPPMTLVGDGIAAFFTHVGTVVRTGYGRYRRWRRISKTVHELSGLSDHVLKDIGVHRGEIPWVADTVTDNHGRLMR